MTGGNRPHDATEHSGFLGGVGWFLRRLSERPVLEAVEADADNGEGVGMRMLELNERGHFFRTRRAPGGPEIEEDRATSEFGQAVGAAFQIGQLEIRDTDAGWGGSGLRQHDCRGVVLAVPPLAPEALGLGDPLTGRSTDFRREDAAMSGQGVREAEAGVEPAPPTQDGIGGESDARLRIGEAIEQCRSPASISNTAERLKAESADFRIGVQDLRSQNRWEVFEGCGCDQPECLLAQTQVRILHGFAENLGPKRGIAVSWLSEMIQDGASVRDFSRIPECGQGSVGYGNFGEMVCEGVAVESIGLEKFSSSEVFDEMRSGEPGEEEGCDGCGSEPPKSLGRMDGPSGVRMAKGGPGLFGFGVHVVSWGPFMGDHMDSRRASERQMSPGLSEMMPSTPMRRSSVARVASLMV